VSCLRDLLYYFKFNQNVAIVQYPAGYGPSFSHTLQGRYSQKSAHWAWNPDQAIEVGSSYIRELPTGISIWCYHSLAGSHAGSVAAVLQMVLSKPCDSPVQYET
jgi:soluble lytic murein transglycosylase-like protein